MADAVYLKRMSRAPPLRLAVMMMVMRAYERGDGDGEMSAAPVEGWIAPYRVVRL